MQNAAPTILPTNRISGPPTFPDLQMPPAQLVPHSRQMPQIFPLLESLQMPPGSPVNPGFQVFPSHFPPHPQVDPHPGPQVLSNAPMREWRGRIRYSPEQKRELENLLPLNLPISTFHEVIAENSLVPVVYCIFYFGIFC